MCIKHASDRLSDPSLALLAAIVSDARPGISPLNDHTHAEGWDRGWRAVIADIEPNRHRVGASNPDKTNGRANYLFTDPRVSPASTRWVSYHLKSVRYWGDGRGLLSLWNSTGGDPVVWMTMTNGIGPDDRFLLAVGGHVHMNWGFSDVGWYEVDAYASAYITYPTVHTTSPPARIYFGIGVTGAPPAELTMRMDEEGAPVIAISAPGPGGRRLELSDDLRAGIWEPVELRTSSWWSVRVTNGVHGSVYRLVR